MGQRSLFWAWTIRREVERRYIQCHLNLLNHISQRNSVRLLISLSLGLILRNGRFDSGGLAGPPLLPVSFFGSPRMRLPHPCVLCKGGRRRCGQRGLESADEN